MKDLIEALSILAKYQREEDFDNPTHCEHDVLMVMVQSEVSEEDTKRLDELSFHWSSEYDCWVSYRFGSA